MSTRLLAAITACALLTTAQAGLPAAFEIPVTYFKLRNGLRVVLSPDNSMQTVMVRVLFKVGSRHEAPNRSGMAHLFEHLMYEASENLGPGEYLRLVRKNGGISNGTTRHDSTVYFQEIPPHALERALWAEADRFRGLALTEAGLRAHKDVVTNEVMLNVLNRPYGGFPRLVLAQHAYANWRNAHNSYGELQDIAAVTLAEAQAFFRTHYVPANAALALVGNFTESTVRRMIDRHFSSLSAGVASPAPDFAEPPQVSERRHVHRDRLAPRPAVALGYHMPPRHTPEFYAMAILDQLFLQGPEARLPKALAARGVNGAEVSGGVNLELGNQFNYLGPMLWTISATYDAETEASEVLRAIDHEVERVCTTPVSDGEWTDLLVQVRSELYNRFLAPSRTDLLASLALFDDDPARINRLEQGIRAVTPALLQKTAQQYLRATNRTVIQLERAPADARQTPNSVSARPLVKSADPSASTARKILPPPLEKPRPAQLHATQTVTLPNGFAATLIDWGVVPKVAVRLVVDVGVTDDPPDTPGLAQLTAQMLQARPLARDARSAADLLLGMGGRLEVLTSPDDIVIAADVLTEFAADAVSVLSQVAESPHFSEAELSRQRQSLLARATAAGARGASIADERFLATLFEGHPYGRPAVRGEALERVTLDDVTAFHRRTFVARRAHLYVLGRFDAAHVKGVIQSAFGDWSGGPPAERSVTPTASGDTLHVIDVPGALQSAVQLGLPVIGPNHPDFMTLRVTNALLGARIAQNIRSQRG